jgi:predicted nucleic acid-binding protein
VDALRALFDSNVLIDYLNGVAAAKTELARYEIPAISVVTWIEVLVGASPGAESATRGFLSNFERIEVTDVISEKAVAIRRTTGLRIPDAIILATAVTENLLLVTRNSKDFGPASPGIRVPYRL